MTTKLLSYAQEISPTIRTLLKKKEILADFKKEDAKYLSFEEEIKEVKARQKVYLGEAEAELLEEIKDLTNDIKAGVKAMAEGTEYDSKDILAYLQARARDKVEVVVVKGVTFASLEEELA